MIVYLDYHYYYYFIFILFMFTFISFWILVCNATTLFLIFVVFCRHAASVPITAGTHTGGVQ